MKKKNLAITSGLLLLVAVLYSANRGMVIKIISLIFVIIGTEFVSIYYGNKKKMYKNLNNFNEDYYDMYIAYISMNNKLLVVCFGILFPYIHEIASYLLVYESDIGNIFVPFVLSFFATAIGEIGICSMFNKTKYSIVFCEIFKKRKNDFFTDFTDDEKKIIKNILTQ